METSQIQTLATSIEERLFNRLAKVVSAAMPRKYLSATEVCSHFGISKPTLHDWRRKGILRSYQLGSRVYYRMDEIEAAMTVVN